jgi:hypothetical protein
MKTSKSKSLFISDITAVILLLSKMQGQPVLKEGSPTEVACPNNLKLYAFSVPWFPLLSLPQGKAENVWLWTQASSLFWEKP